MPRRTIGAPTTVLFAALVSITTPQLIIAQTQDKPSSPQAAESIEWQYGGFADFGFLGDFNTPSNHLFRNRGTTPRVDELGVNMALGYIRKKASESSRWGVELTGQGGEDSKIFGFSATAPNIGGADWLLHLGPTNASYLAPVGSGLTVQGGIFSSFIGYDSLYARDNFNYTRPWGADYTPYLMLGVNASYDFTKNLTGTFLLVNGYWHLAHANDVPSIGGQISYKASDHVTVKQTALYGPHQSNTSLTFWRWFSDTIVERKTDRITVAFEYQLGSENVDAPGTPRALWTSAQLPIHFLIRAPLSVTVRPEFAWDRDGRWIGAPQSVKAITSTLEYRLPYRKSQTIVRLEHRYDEGHGASGGFFNDGEVAPGVVGVTPGQHLLTVGLILTFDSTFRR